MLALFNNQMYAAQEESPPATSTSRSDDMDEREITSYLLSVHSV
jgi:hypothetical protein